jgi:nucleotide-binding universal stress UspA family protein
MPYDLAPQFLGCGQELELEVAMYRVIVVGTDGSDRAAIAVAHAIVLAKITGGTLHVVHAVRPVAMAGSGNDFAAVAVGEANMMFDRGDHTGAQALAQAAREGVSAEMHSADGDPADALIAIAESCKADLVVVGNRGMTGIKRFVLGSVANRLSHHCPCNLLIVSTDTAS